MSDEADRFRARAQECRTLARVARDLDSRKSLNGIADDLDAEAAEIDADKGPKGT